MKFYFQIFLLVFFFQFGQSKKARFNFDVDEYKSLWAYSTKFASPSQSQIEIILRTRLVKPQTQKLNWEGLNYLNLEIAVLQESDWEKVQNQQPTCAQIKQQAQVVHEVPVPFTGTWSDAKADPVNKHKMKFEFTNGEKTQMYYFIVMDCNQEIEGRFRRMENDQIPQIVVEYNIQRSDSQTDKTHFSYEEHHSLSLSICLTVIQVLLSTGLIASYIASIRSLDRCLSPHPVMLIGLFLQTFALIMETTHLYVYSLDGTGWPIYDMLSKVFQVMSETALTALLFFFAHGWTITFQNLDIIDDGEEWMFPLALFVMMTQMLNAIMTHYDMEAAHMHHDFAGYQGYILFVLKVFVWLGFLYIWRKTNEKIEIRQKSYFHQLCVSGSVYLLAIPAAISYTWFFGTYNRQFVFSLVSHGLHFGVNLVLFFQISYKGSTYQKANLDALGLLPTTLTSAQMFGQKKRSLPVRRKRL